MKKTSKLFALIAGIVLLFTGTAKAEGFDIGADVVSRYVWRGTDFGNSAAVQPWLSYTFPGIGVEVGAWGSWAIDGNDDGNEADLYLTIPLGNFSFTVTDYFFPAYNGMDDYLDWSEDGGHIVELSAGFEAENISLLAAINVFGNDTEDSKYFEAGYNFYDKDDYSASFFVGGGDESYTTDGEFNIVNVGLAVSKDIFSASYIVNPDQETSFFVVGITLQP